MSTKEILDKTKRLRAEMVRQAKKLEDTQVMYAATFRELQQSLRGGDLTGNENLDQAILGGKEEFTDQLDRDEHTERMQRLNNFAEQQ